MYLNVLFSVFNNVFNCQNEIILHDQFFCLMFSAALYDYQSTVSHIEVRHSSLYIISFLGVHNVRVLYWCWMICILRSSYCIIKYKNVYIYHFSRCLTYIHFSSKYLITLNCAKTSLLKIYRDAGIIFYSKLLHEESQQNHNLRKFKIQVLLHFVLFIPKFVLSIFYFIFFPLADAAKFPQETKEIMEKKIVIT